MFVLAKISCFYKNPTEVPGPFGFNLRRDSKETPAALQSRRRCRHRRRLESRRRRRGYIMTMARFTIYVMLLGVKVGNSSRQSCAMRCSAGAGAGDLRGRRRRRRDYIMPMARFTIYVMLLGVKVGNSCRQSCAMRCNPSAGAGIIS